MTDFSRRIWHVDTMIIDAHSRERLDTLINLALEKAGINPFSGEPMWEPLSIAQQRIIMNMTFPHSVPGCPGCLAHEGYWREHRAAVSAAFGPVNIDYPLATVPPYIQEAEERKKEDAKLIASLRAQIRQADEAFDEVKAQRDAAMAKVGMHTVVADTESASYKTGYHNGVCEARRRIADILKDAGITLARMTIEPS